MMRLRAVWKENGVKWGIEKTFDVNSQLEAVREMITELRKDRGFTKYSKLSSIEIISRNETA